MKGRNLFDTFCKISFLSTSSNIFLDTDVTRVVWLGYIMLPVDTPFLVDLFGSSCFYEWCHLLETWFARKLRYIEKETFCLKDWSFVFSFMESLILSALLLSLKKFEYKSWPLLSVSSEMSFKSLFFVAGFSTSWWRWSFTFWLCGQVK